MESAIVKYMYWGIGLFLGLGFIFMYRHVLKLLGIIIVPETSIGIVTKNFVLFGTNKTLPDGRVVALNGEAGVQAETLAPGIYFWYWPWQYSVDMEQFTVIQEGQIGIVTAIDGDSIKSGHILGKRVECETYQDGKGFILNGGEKGPQINVIRPGNYRINTKLFHVKIENAVNIPENKVGIVTTFDGDPLSTGEIAGNVIDRHNLFQDGQMFVEKGGKKGLQEQVILAGTYYLNPLFVEVGLIDMTEIKIGTVGVVVSYVGAEGRDTSGEVFTHGSIVTKGEKGVWAQALTPGKYPINTRLCKVEMVPTTNIVLNWANAKSESHNLDSNLSTITVRSNDGFTFNLDVSQIIHIASDAAPKVIARFGSMNNLVTQVLEPLIGNYFRNSAQTSDVISFLSERTARQNQAKEFIAAALKQYNVVAVDTLIGDIVPPAELMKTLTDKKIAEKQKQTFETQKEAEIVRQDFEKAKANADTQASVITAERKVAIAEYEANAAIKKADGDSKAKEINSLADKNVLINIGQGDASKNQSIGESEAKVIQLKGEAEAKIIQLKGESEANVAALKVKSVGIDNYAIIAVMEEISAGKIAIVPTVQGGAGGTGFGESILALMANKMGVFKEVK